MEKGPVSIKGLCSLKKLNVRILRYTIIRAVRNIANRLVNDLSGLKTIMGRIQNIYQITITNINNRNINMETVRPNLWKAMAPIARLKKAHTG